MCFCACKIRIQIYKNKINGPPNFLYVAFPLFKGHNLNYYRKKLKAFMGEGEYRRITVINFFSPI